MAAVLGLLVAGCGQDGGTVSMSEAATRVTDRAPAHKAEVSLPPGDPGLDAPPAPDPGRALAAAPEHTEEKRPRTVPGRALLTVEDLQRTYGGRWQQRPGGADECVVPEGALAARTTSYGGTPAGTVVETVAAYGDVRRADAAVLDLRYTAERCGWTDVHDPRIGSAAVAAADGQGRSMVAVSAEGALVVLVGAGRVATGWKWDALVDLAVGSSCPAAVGGCH